MKTLRLVRNIAVLFILVMGLLPARPAAANGGPGAYCVGAFKSGISCSFDYSTNTCTETKCADPKNCADSRCAKLGKSGF